MQEEESVDALAPASVELAGGEPLASFPVVGIGASAGGLQALQRFFEHTPPASGMAFVVVMHLAPEQESHLATLLQGFTTMPVAQVHESLELLPNQVYVIPPNRNLDTLDTHLRLSPLEAERSMRAPIDHFLHTLADTHAAKAIGVILSGTGSDGTLGLRQIQAAGGLTVAQDPADAEYDGMPQSAIAAGVADLILPADQIPGKLIEYRRRAHQASVPSDGEALPEDERIGVQHILAQVQAYSGHDFTGYKASTVLRRIRRRMQIHGLQQLENYVNFLSQHNDETQALFNDFLIPVTNFFRDPEAFAVLEREVIPVLFRDKTGGDQVRVWVAGCATGEEAYALGILLLEYAQPLDHPPRLQILATDLSAEALSEARAGFYLESIALDITSARLARFFVKEPGGYRVHQALREIVLFAPHSLLDDPPFSKLDLLTCRNVLIYLQPSIRQRLLELFHYALQPAGYLFLGSAETVEGSPLFRAVNRRACIFQCQPRPAGTRSREMRLPTLPLSVSALPIPTEVQSLEQPNLINYEALRAQLLGQYAPPSLVVDTDYNIVYLFEGVTRYLRQPRGEPTNNLLRQVREELRVELTTGLYRAFERGEASQSQPIPVHFDGVTYQVILTIRPVVAPMFKGVVFVCFHEYEAADQAASLPNHQTVSSLAAELQATHNQLRTTIEAHETTQEEVKAANEALLAMNEELRSTTEELETSKEELQANNEELLTLNQELEDKVKEVTQAHSDLQNFFAATDIATLFLDRELRIIRYTPPAAALFNLIPPDQGRPLAHLHTNLHYAQLETDAEQVLTTLLAVEREVQSQTGRWFLLHMRSYRTLTDEIDGVVITCVDITACKQAEERFQKVFEHAPNGMLIVDSTDKIVLVNAQAEAIFGYRRDELLGQSIELLIPLHTRNDPLRYHAAFLAHPTARSMEDSRDLVGLHKDGHEFPIDVGWTPIEIEEGQMVLSTVIDITERKRAETNQIQLLEEVERQRTQLRTLNQKLATAQETERKELARELHDRVGQNLTALSLTLQLIQHQLAPKLHNGDPVQTRLMDAQALLAQMANQIRDVMADLHPPTLDDYGLLATLHWYASQLTRRTGLSIHVQGVEPTPRLDEAVEVTLFRIAQEALTNVIKHAQATAVRVTLTIDDEQVHLQIADNGRGIASATVDRGVQPSGWGIVAMQERVAAIGGRLHIESQPGQGTSITVEVKR